MYEEFKNACRQKRWEIKKSNILALFSFLVYSLSLGRQSFEVFCCFRRPILADR